MNPRIIAKTWATHESALRRANCPPNEVENYRRFFWIGAHAFAGLEETAAATLSQEGFNHAMDWMRAELAEFVQQCDREVSLFTARAANDRPA